MRFLNVGIPAGSTIDSASIQFTVDEDDKGPAPANYVIFGEMSPNPATFTSANSNITDRDATSNVGLWLDVPSWTGQVGQAGPDQKTPDLAAVVQEIIDQAGWASGNAMAFGITPVDLATGEIDLTSEANRTAESFDGSAGAAPLLEITFTPIPEPSAAILALFGCVALLVSRRR